MICLWFVGAFKMNVFAASVYTIILCLPFGYWRTATRRFSLPWFLAIHLPVLLIIPVRRYWLHLSLWWLFLLVPLFFLGQKIGAMIRERWQRESPSNTSACLVLDLWSRIHRRPPRSPKNGQESEGAVPVRISRRNQCGRRDC